MAWGESKAWLKGRTAGRLYQNQLDEVANQPARNARRKKIVRPDDMPSAWRL